MDRRVAAVGVAVLLLSSVIVVQILDPRFGEREPPEVDFSEPPNEVAADAAAQFEYVDYAYRVDVKYNGSDEWRQWGVAWVDNTNRTYRKVGPGGMREEVLYGTTAAGFVRPAVSEDWRVIGRPGYEYPASFLTQPIYLERVRKADAHVVNESPSAVIIHVNVCPVKIIGDYPGNAMVVVNKSTRMVERIDVAYNPGRGGIRYLRLRVIEEGTTVERPEGLGFSSKEVFWDLIRGPVFRFV